MIILAEPNWCFAAHVLVCLPVSGFCGAEAALVTSCRSNADVAVQMDVEGIRRLIDVLPADDTDLWSCSKAFRMDLVEWFALEGPKLRAVEIGAYRGLTTLVLSHVFASVVTIDINSTFLRMTHVRTKSRCNIQYVLADSAIDRWWVATGDAEVLLIDGAHDYDAVRRDVDMGLRYLPSLKWMILDDYGSLVDPARVVEEYLSLGDFARCEPLGRRSGEQIPVSGLRINGPEAVLCSISKDQILQGHTQTYVRQKVTDSDAASENDKEEGSLGLSLHGRLYEVCLAPCNLLEHVTTKFGGHVNFTESSHEDGSCEGGSVNFTSFLGGGHGRWQQTRPGALLVIVRYKGRGYYFAFLPGLKAFQANEVGVAGSAEVMAFKASQVVQISSEWFGDLAQPLYRASYRD